MELAGLEPATSWVRNAAEIAMGLTIPLAGTSVTPLGHAQSRSASTTVDGPPMRSKSAEAIAGSRSHEF